MTKPAAPSISDHLQGFSAVSVPAGTAAAALTGHLMRFGPVRKTILGDFQEALGFILPVKSFTTRYVVLQMESWSVLFTDMWGENCYVEAYAISRVTNCRAIGVFIQQQRRELHLFERGRKLRQIQSLKEENEWYYREEGSFQPFEDIEETSRRRKSERLTPQAVRKYFRDYTSLEIPTWGKTTFKRILGLERSIKNLQLPLLEIELVKDI